MKEQHLGEWRAVQHLFWGLLLGVNTVTLLSRAAGEAAISKVECSWSSPASEPGQT